MISFIGLFLIASCIQEAEIKKNPVVEVKNYMVGSTRVRVQSISYLPASKYVFLKLHDNESTAEAAALELIRLNGGQLLTIENHDRRTVKITYKGKPYEFDPNRMFTKTGINLSLKRYGNYQQAVLPAIERFSENIISSISKYPFVITVHNNTDKNYSLLDYATGDLKKDARAVHRNASMDTDDFVFTTDQKLFDYLQAADINVVLQDNEDVTNDGSLSYYYGKTNKFYVNVEAQMGHKKEQVKMIGKVLEFLNRL